MSFLQRTSYVTPFAQITNSTTFSTGTRFDTVSTTWLTAGSTGYTIDNSKGFISAFISLNNTGTLFAARLNGTNDRWKWGSCVYGGASRAQNDDEFFDYSSTTEWGKYPSAYDSGNHNPKSRFNVMRMEVTT